AWLATLDDDTLQEIFDLEPGSPPKERFPLWYYVLHIHTHTQQQLGDAAVLLTRMRQSPGNIEFLEYADFLHREGPRPVGHARVRVGRPCEWRGHRVCRQSRAGCRVRGEASRDSRVCSPPDRRAAREAHRDPTRGRRDRVDRREL